ncbi:MAG: hypothetical protein ABIZ81_07455 [Opitutaceae bacterium]
MKTDSSLILTLLVIFAGVVTAIFAGADANTASTAATPADVASHVQLVP